MYLQAVNPHPTAISTQLGQFCSWPPCPPSPVFAVHHVPHCWCETGIWSWMRKRHWGCPCLSEQIRWGRPWWRPPPPASWTAKAGDHVWDNLAIAVSAPSFCVLLSMSTTTCNTFKHIEASENWAPLTDVVWTETSRTNLTKITSSLPFGHSLDALAGSGVTEDEETTATSSPDEAVRAGGVTESLIHGTGSFPVCCYGLLHPHCSQQSADISDLVKIHKCNTKAVILTKQSHLISVLEVTNWSYFMFLFQVLPLFSLKCCHHLSLQVLLHHRQSAVKAQKLRFRKVLYSSAKLYRNVWNYNNLNKLNLKI